MDSAGWPTISKVAPCKILPLRCSEVSSDPVGSLAPSGMHGISHTAGSQSLGCLWFILGIFVPRDFSSPCCPCHYFLMSRFPGAGCFALNLGPLLGAPVPCFSLTIILSPGCLNPIFYTYSQRVSNGLTLHHVGVTWVLELPLLDRFVVVSTAWWTPLITHKPLWHYILDFWTSEKHSYRWVTPPAHWPQLPLTLHWVMLVSPQPHSTLPPPTLGQFTLISVCISDRPISDRTLKKTQIFN